MKIDKFLILSAVIYSVLFCSCVSRSKYNHIKDELKTSQNELNIAVDSNLVLLKRVQLLKEDLDKFVRNSSIESRNSLFASFNTNNRHVIKFDSTCSVDRDKLVAEIFNFIGEKLMETPFLAVNQNDYRISEYLRKSVYVHSGYSSILMDNPRFEEIIYIVTIYYEPQEDAVSIHIDYLPMVSSTKADNQLFVSSTDRLTKYSKAIDQMLNKLYISSKIKSCTYGKD